MLVAIKPSPGLSIESTHHDDNTLFQYPRGTLWSSRVETTGMRRSRV